MGQKLSKQALKHKRAVTQTWINKRYANDATYRELRNTRALLSQTFRKHLEGLPVRSNTLENITGIPTLELMQHLTASAPSTFNPKLYGSHFEIDHIVPVAEFQTLDDASLALSTCFHPNNLRIIEKHKNRPGRNVVSNRTRNRFGKV